VSFATFILYDHDIKSCGVEFLLTSITTNAAMTGLDPLSNNLKAWKTYDMVELHLWGLSFSPGIVIRGAHLLAKLKFTTKRLDTGVLLSFVRTIMDDYRLSTVTSETR
jgi:hypothetical protein